MTLKFECIYLFKKVRCLLTLHLPVGYVLVLRSVKAEYHFDELCFFNFLIKVELALQVQHILPERFRKRFIVRQETIFPNKTNRALGFFDRLFGSGMLDGAAIMKSLTINQVLTHHTLIRLNRAFWIAQI